MRIREVLLFAEALRDYYREMAALAEGGMIRAEIIRPPVGELTRVLTVTPPSPSIPFVTSSATPADLTTCLQSALLKVAREPELSAVRAGLMLRDIVPTDLGNYAIQLTYEREAAALGYPVLH